MTPWDTFWSVVAFIVYGAFALGACIIALVLFANAISWLDGLQKAAEERDELLKEREGDIKRLRARPGGSAS